ncbi:MAG: SMP-30/gluconolactonase/LRE family protein [Chloroflexi bacterium]|nr:SMP-30/gluconolactonase/LRE family protein [Chloroflexota bacterium]
MLPDWTFEDALPVIGSITEGAAWDGNRLLFTNIAMNRVLAYDPATGAVVTERTGTNAANGLNFDREGRLFACEGRGRRIARYDDGQPGVTIVDRLGGKRINSPNDLAIDPQGRIYFSDRIGDVSPEMGIAFSAIISADPQADGSYIAVQRTFDSTMPNGLLFSADYRTLYVAESDYGASRFRQLRGYPVNEDGSLGDYALLHDFGPHRGIDGMTLSSDGLIVACTGWEISGPGGMITIFEPDGRIVATHPTPCQRPTNCTFVGEDLYVTSIEGHLLVARDTGMTGHLLYP